MKKRVFATALLIATFSLSAQTPAAATGGTKVGTTAGKTYGEWAARWWQWVYSIPAAQNPQNLQGPVNCGLNQGGPVWFLAGTHGGTAARSCTVPKHKPLFFPVLNLLYLNDVGENLSVAEKREILDGVLSDTVPGFFADFGFPGSRACKIEVTLDGEPVSFDAPIARTQTPAFPLDTNDAPVGTLPADLFDPAAISDGFWVMLPPLAPGQHTLRFTGRLCEFDTFDDHPLFGPVDVTYQLNVTHH